MCVCSWGISGCSSLVFFWTRPGDCRPSPTASTAPADVASGVTPYITTLCAVETGSGCESLLSAGAGQDAAGRHLLQHKGLSQAAAAARAHRGYMQWVHGQMMIFAFVGLVPLGVWMAYARKTLPSAAWFHVHRIVQVRPSACPTMSWP